MKSDLLSGTNWQPKATCGPLLQSKNLDKTWMVRNGRDTPISRHISRYLESPNIALYPRRRNRILSDPCGNYEAGHCKKLSDYKNKIKVGLTVNNLFTNTRCLQHSKASDSPRTGPVDLNRPLRAVPLHSFLILCVCWSSYSSAGMKPFKPS